jgi:carboxymethylenebutenolidase
MTEGRFVRFRSPDGHEFDCWQVCAQREPRGAVVVLQEIFGVNSHIRSVCARLAAESYDAYAPALFDRLQPGFTSGYSEQEVTEARKFLQRLDWHAMVGRYRHDRAAGGRSGLRVGLMGFCLGASVAYLAAQREPGISAVVGYYGGHIARHLEQPPHSPTLLHFGATDHTIPMTDVERIRAERPECAVHVYPAGHGFNCDERASFEPRSAALAWERSMQWLAKHVA